MVEVIHSLNSQHNLVHRIVRKSLPAEQVASAAIAVVAAVGLATIATTSLHAEYGGHIVRTSSGSASLGDHRLKMSERKVPRGIDDEPNPNDCTEPRDL